MTVQSLIYCIGYNQTKNLCNLETKDTIYRILGRVTLTRSLLKSNLGDLVLSSHCGSRRLLKGQHQRICIIYETSS